MRCRIELGDRSDRAVLRFVSSVVPIPKIDTTFRSARGLARHSGDRPQRWDESARRGTLMGACHCLSAGWSARAEQSRPARLLLACRAHV